MNIWPSWKEHGPFAASLLALLIALVMYVGVKVDNTLKMSEQIGEPTPFEHTIYIEGEGRVTGTPDIATLSMSVETKGETVAEAQVENTQTMNKIIELLKGMDIAEDDIQTASYNVYENTEWNAETESYESKGWIVSQTVTVKVRDTERIGDVLAMAGQNGITNIFGPTFTIDDPTNLKAEARTKAVEDAQKKITELSRALGVQIERVVGFSEWYEMPGKGYPFANFALAEGMGGGEVPSIETGSLEVIMHVSITYKLVE